MSNSLRAGVAKQGLVMSSLQGKPQMTHLKQLRNPLPESGPQLIGRRGVQTHQRLLLVHGTHQCGAIPALSGTREKGRDAVRRGFGVLHVDDWMKVYDRQISVPCSRSHRGASRPQSMHSARSARAPHRSGNSPLMELLIAFLASTAAPPPPTGVSAASKYSRAETCWVSGWVGGWDGGWVGTSNRHHRAYTSATAPPGAPAHPPVSGKSRAAATGSWA